MCASMNRTRRHSSVSRHQKDRWVVSLTFEGRIVQSQDIGCIEEQIELLGSRGLPRVRWSRYREGL